jgi:hypothetical protein
MIEDEIIALYRCSGYTPDETIKSLLQLVGCAVLSKGVNKVDYVGENLSVTVTAEETK